jgi:hypothetical protein
MAPDVLTKKVLRRLKELGLPACLVDMEEFRDRFFLQHWVMFVRDSDKIAHVHLVQPPQGKGASRTRRGDAGPTRSGKTRGS